MKIFQLFLLLLTFSFCSCASTSINHGPQKLKVRLTTYSKNEKHCDRWTRRGKSSTGVRLQEGYAAADPEIIPYFSYVEIPEIKLKLQIVDTGGAVKSRLASRRNGRNEPILDIFFHKEKDAVKFRLNNPQIVEALIIN